MKKTALHIIFLLSLFHTACVAQKDSASKATDRIVRSNKDFRFEAFIPGKYLDVSIDVLDNIYLLTNGYQLKKINNVGDSVGVFNEVKKYGNPSLIDVSNPLKILVYYKSFSTVVILDRLLTLRHTINLRKQNIFSVKAIATSYDNNIWLFDEQDNKLKKMDDDGRILQESTDMRMLVDSTPSPSLIIDSENQVYLYDETKGFFIFDYYGALQKNLPFSGWQNPTVAKKRMYGFNNGELLSYELGSMNLRKYPLPSFFQEIRSMKAMNNKVYLLKDDGVEIYSVL